MFPVRNQQILQQRKFDRLLKMCCFVEFGVGLSIAALDAIGDIATGVN